jgi:hypothetical protein
MAQYPVYTQYPQEDPREGHSSTPTPTGGFTLMLRAAVLLALSVALAVIVSVVSATEAHAQDMSAELEEFNATCFDSAAAFEATDGCYMYAESLGLEIENINESMDKGCVLSDLHEDYSCKGPSAPSSSSVSEQEEVRV